MNAHIATNTTVLNAAPGAYEDPALYGALDDAQTAEAPADDTEDEASEDQLNLKLITPLTFGGVTYETLDLHGLESLKAGDLKRVSKLYMKLHPAANPATLESNLEFTFLIASRILAQPLEFFDSLSARDAIALKTVVVGFLFNADGTD